VHELAEIKHVLKGGYVLAKIEQPNRIPTLYSGVRVKTGIPEGDFGKIVDIIGSTKSPYALVKLGKEGKNKRAMYGRKKDRVY